MMDERTLTALRGSIAKWEAIADGTGEDNSSQNCPLCIAFLHEYDEGDRACSGCPVREATGFTGCVNTPYDDNWVAHRNRVHGVIGGGVECGHCRRAARAEVAFLKSLLPAQGIEARSDETPLGGSALLGESPVGKADAP